MYYKWKIYYHHYYYPPCCLNCTTLFMISRLRPKRHFSTLSPGKRLFCLFTTLYMSWAAVAAEKTEICLCFDLVLQLLNCQLIKKFRRKCQQSFRLKGKKLKNLKWVIWKKASANHLAKLASLMHCLRLPKRRLLLPYLNGSSAKGAHFLPKKIATRHSKFCVIELLNYWLPPPPHNP